MRLTLQMQVYAFHNIHCDSTVDIQWSSWVRSMSSGNFWKLAFQ